MLLMLGRALERNPKVRCGLWRAGRLPQTLAPSSHDTALQKYGITCFEKKNAVVAHDIISNVTSVVWGYFASAMSRQLVIDFW